VESGGGHMKLKGDTQTTPIIDFLQTLKNIFDKSPTNTMIFLNLFYQYNQ
jgi:hypothetical protein